MHKYIHQQSFTHETVTGLLKK